MYTQMYDAHPTKSCARMFILAKIIVDYPADLSMDWQTNCIVAIGTGKRENAPHA